MTSLGFLETLAPWLRNRDLATLDPSDCLLLAQRINLALSEWAQHMPASARQRTVSYRLPAPRQINVTTSAGATALTVNYGALTAADAGRSIYLGNDTLWHRLDGTGQSLRMPASTTGTTAAVVYHDSLTLPAGFETLTGQPVASAGSMDQYSLQPMRDSGIWAPGLRWLEHLLLGSVPTHYQITPEDSLNGSSGAQASMRIFPVPVNEYAISIPITALPVRWTLADFTTARVLDLSDRSWDLLVDVVVGKLKGTHLLRQDADVNLLAANASESVAGLRSTPPLTSGHNRVGTPDNY